MTPRQHLCEIEEEKGERALNAIEEAVETLRLVLNEIYRVEEEEENGGQSAGTD
jgi:hypothetical protein